VWVWCGWGAAWVWWGWGGGGVGGRGDVEGVARRGGSRIAIVNAYPSLAQVRPIAPALIRRCANGRHLLPFIWGRHRLFLLRKNAIIVSTLRWRASTSTNKQLRMHAGGRPCVRGAGRVVEEQAVGKCGGPGVKMADCEHSAE